jgi:hypothetical protein
VGKEPMVMHGIRNAFVASDSLSQQVLAFRDEALRRLGRRTGPAPNLSWPPVGGGYHTSRGPRRRCVARGGLKLQRASPS